MSIDGRKCFFAVFLTVARDPQFLRMIFISNVKMFKINPP
jgi:hypothetical protein